MVYEGYGPFGIAILVETQTDNTTRTVANVRSYLTRHGGTLGTSGSLSFIFDRKSVFKVIPKEGIDVEELELDIIDYGAEELEMDENEIVIYGQPEDFARIQNYLEENGYEIVSAEFERFPNDVKDVTDEQRATLDKLIEKLEDDEDVSAVYHNMTPAPEEAE
jgi:YebC/PmpR family DNA-binding regulatory protein